MTKRQVKPLNLSGVDPYDPSGTGRGAPTLHQPIPEETALTPPDTSFALPDIPLSGPLPGSQADFDPPPIRERPKTESKSIAHASRRERRRTPKVQKNAVEARTAAPPATLGPARYAYLIAALGGLVWAGCFIAFVLGFQHHVAPLDYAPFQAVILAMLTVLPAAFMLLAAFAVRQAAVLAADTRAARQQAQDMTAPALLAAANAGGVMEILRGEIERSAAAARAAHDELAGLSRSLTSETDRLTQAAGDAQRTARIIGETLTAERDEVASLVADLHAGVQEIAMGVDSQTRLVADASDLARSQLQEAEAVLAVRAADLNAASAAASASVRDAGELLTQNTHHLDAAGAALVERLRHLEVRLGEQRADMAELVAACDADRTELTARLETRRAQLIDAIAQARVGAAELDDASGQSADMLSKLVASAGDRMRDLVHGAHAEHQALAAQAVELRTQTEVDLQRGVATLGKAVQDAYQVTVGHADQARQAAQAHIEAAKEQVEQLGEVAFNAGQKANQAFDARISDARKLIERSADLVEQAGANSAGRIDAGLDAARASLSELTRTLSDIDARMDRFPEDTRNRAQAIRAAVDQGIGDLTASARRVAEETQAIDASFQDRVKRNYETLSDAVRLMGRVASAAEAPAPIAQPGGDLKFPAAPTKLAPVLSPPPAPPEPPAAPRRTPPVDIAPPEVLYEREIEAAPSRPKPNGAAETLTAQNGRGKPPVFGRASQRELSDDALFATAEDQPVERNGAPPTKGFEPGARARLRLTPTEADEALKTVFNPLQAKSREAVAARTPRNEGDRWENDLDEWTWRDLLSSMEEAPAAEDDLADQMVDEIAALGIDLGTLLPRGKLEQIAASLASDDPSAVRDSVRRLAPAAIRRLSRRVLTDKTLRERADRYVRRYDSLLRGSLEYEGDTAAVLLSTDPGRAYLLLDAAVGDLQ